MIGIRRTAGRYLLAFSVAILFLPTVYQPSVHAAPPGLDPADVPLPPLPAYSKLDALLNRLVGQLGSRSATQLAVAAPLARGESVGVSIRTRGDTDALATFLNARGATLAMVGQRVIEAYVPLTQLVALNSHPAVLTVRAITPPRAAVTSQGTAVHGSPNWNGYGFTGAGVKVGIIDVGFYGYGSLVVAGELPVPAAVRCYEQAGIPSNSLSACESNGDYHGTGVAEALVDTAPQVTLYLAKALSAGDWRSSVEWMIAQGVRVINHSAGFGFNEPGDGIPIPGDELSPFPSIDLAVNAGIVWINAAGNQADKSWKGSYVDANLNNFVEFQPGIELNAFQAFAGESLIIEARWEDSWTAAARNLDLILYYNNGGVLSYVDASRNPQNGTSGDAPYEQLQLTAPLSGTYYLALQRTSGTIPGWVQAGTRFQILALQNPASSIMSPAESRNAGMLTVAAAPWSATATIELFSSRGPTIDGRVKPDVTGADRGDSVALGTGGFAGTSQAAPHLAGMAALFRQRYPAATPIQVAQYFRQNAQPRGLVPNPVWGYGFAVLPPVATYTLALTSTPGGNASASPPGPVYIADTLIQLTATPTSGYSFTGWTINGAPAGSTNPLSLTMNTNHTVVANFAPGVPPPPPPASGLQYYPLAQPVRLFDSRPGQPACQSTGAPLAAGGTLAIPAAVPCTGVPATARALVTNVTVDNSQTRSPGGYLTLWPSDAPRPTASNLNYVAGQVVPNQVTVGLAADGSFSVYAAATTHLLVDVAGYYAPPGAGGLYYHPLPAPVRLLDTRPGQPACDTPGAPLAAGGERAQPTLPACTGVPAGAKAIVGNATVDNAATRAPGGYVTLWPSGAARPTVSTLNYTPGQVVPNAFAVGLGGDGAFGIFATSGVHLIVDITGYYSDQPTGPTGAGLRFNPLPAPVRLLDTRPGQVACDTPGAPLAAGGERAQGILTGCTGVPADARAVVGNATVDNGTTRAPGGYVTLWPVGAARPVASNLNYSPGQVVPNAFTVGLGGGAFGVFATSGTHLVVDLSGYFAP